MANLTRNFSSGVMNKSVDERLIPNGQYIDALNVRMGSTEESEVGVIENAKGNLPLTSLSFDGTPLSESARCIGAFQDGSNETLYWCIHDLNFAPSPTGKIDMVVSYDTKAKSIVYHIISMDDGGGINTTLNFNPAYLVTGMNKIENLLYFTDNYTDPKQINVTRNYANPIAGMDQFSLESLLVIKKPPTTSPSIVPISTSSQENFLEDRFISFAYRYRYEDGEYSATSQFSNPSFIPGVFDYNQATALNDGMLNSTNMCDVTYNSGGPLVKSIDLLFKDMNSSVIKIIEKINKEELGINDDQEYTFNFDSSKIFTILPSSEILRLFDNVPRLAEAQTLMGNRLMYGNYLEGYDLKDLVGNPTKLEYFIDYQSESIGLSSQPFSLTDGGSYSWDIAKTIPHSTIEINLNGLELKAGAVINLVLRFDHAAWSGDTPTPTEETQEETLDFTYTLPVNFNSVYELATSIDFTEKIGTASNIKTVADSCTGLTFTDLFNCIIPSELAGTPTMYKYASGISAAGQPVTVITSPSSNKIGLQLPAMLFVDDVTGATITKSTFEYYNYTAGNVSFQEIGNPKSLHSNRGYEIGIVYMDEYNRMSTALVSPLNTVYIPCSNSDTANSIRVTIPSTQVAPSWAKRYKFVIKPDKKDYNIIYSSLFFRDPTSGGDYFLLEGQNSTKVEIGDELIVKADTLGARSNCVWTTVLDKQAQSVDFLSPGPVDGFGTEISQPAGTYIKLKANNFATDIGELPVVAYGEIKKNQGSGCPIVRYPIDTPNTNPANAGEYIDYTLPEGSRITIILESNRPGNSSSILGNVDQMQWKVEAEFTVSQLYNNFEDWFIGDNIAPALESQATDIGGVEGPGFSATATSFPCVSTGTVHSYFSTDNTGTVDVRKYFAFQGTLGYSGRKKSTTATVDISVIRAINTIVFESDPQDAEPDLWYESSASYSIDATGQHSGNFENQDFATGAPAIINTEFFNCFAFGNGVESYKISDSMVGKELVMGNRATTTNSKLYGAEQRFSDITYSGVYNSESNINKLNEFNGGLLNFKILEASFGPIMKLFARETDILTLQEDKISYVLGGKNLLSDAGGGSALMSVPEVLGIQIARVEDFGISHNPESFAEWGPDKFFTDAKRGSVIQLKGSSGQNEQLNVISQAGMRSWFRDLFNDKFSSQKLGGFDPYMNEFVLSSNSVLLPVVKPCKICGITETLIVTDVDTYENCYDLGSLVGTVDINYSVSSVSGTFILSALYNGVTSTTGSTGASGTLTINKNNILKNEVLITIEATSVADLILTVDCPVGPDLTIVLVQVSGDNDENKQIHNQYRWTDGSFSSPLHSTQVTFLSGPSPVVSQYETITGQQGGGVIPSDTAVVKIISNKIGSDNYDFNINSDNFRYLRSNTLYSNTTTQIKALMIASTVPTPINPPTNGNTDYNSTFAMPGSGAYLYIVWDYRDSTPVDLCFGATAIAACCACAASSDIYQVQDCTTGTIYEVEDTYLNGIGINSVVQFVIGIGGAAETYVRCGTLIGFGTVATATLYSSTTQVCGDTQNCDFDSTITCNEYEVSTTSGSPIQYSYTDCDGNYQQDSIGGFLGFDSNTFCAIQGSVNAPSSLNLVDNGACIIP